MRGEWGARGSGKDGWGESVRAVWRVRAEREGPEEVAASIPVEARRFMVSSLTGCRSRSAVGQDSAVRSGRGDSRLEAGGKVADSAARAHHATQQGAWLVDKDVAEYHIASHLSR